MASASSPASLSGPQIQIKPDRLVIKNGVVNSKGVSYDITITFRSAGRDVAPADNLSRLPGLAEDVSSLAQKILKSLPAGFDGENLERLAFLVQNTADESNPDTAILVSNAVQPVLDSWKSGNTSAFSRRDNPKDIPLRYDGTEYEEESKPQNVHEGLIELRGLFEADRFLAMPPSAKQTKTPPSLAPGSPRPNIAVSLDPSRPATPIPSRPPTPVPSPRWGYRSRIPKGREVEDLLRQQQLAEERKAQEMAQLNQSVV